MKTLLRLLKCGVILEFANFLKVVVVEYPRQAPRIHYEPPVDYFESMFILLTSLSIVLLFKIKISKPWSITTN